MVRVPRIEQDNAPHRTNAAAQQLPRRPVGKPTACWPRGACYAHHIRTRPLFNTLKRWRRGVDDHFERHDKRTRTSAASEPRERARRRSGARERVQRSPRGEAPRFDTARLSACCHFFALILAFAVGSLVGAWAIRPARPSASKAENYECGAQPIGEAWVQFPVGFYLVALIFLVFDTLAVFLFPWAVTMRALGMGGLKAMSVSSPSWRWPGSTPIGRGFSSGNKAARSPDPGPVLERRSRTCRSGRRITRAAPRPATSTRRFSSRSPRASIAFPAASR